MDNEGRRQPRPPNAKDPTVAAPEVSFQGPDFLKASKKPIADHAPRHAERQIPPPKPEGMFGMHSMKGI